MLTLLICIQKLVYSIWFNNKMILRPNKRARSVKHCVNEFPSFAKGAKKYIIKGLEDIKKSAKPPIPPGKKASCSFSYETWKQFFGDKISDDVVETAERYIKDARRYKEFRMVSLNHDGFFEESKSGNYVEPDSEIIKLNCACEFEGEGWHHGEYEYILTLYYDMKNYIKFTYIQEQSASSRNAEETEWEVVVENSNWTITYHLDEKQKAIHDDLYNDLMFLLEDLCEDGIWEQVQMDIDEKNTESKRAVERFVQKQLENQK
jgi:hypothetical protein